MKIFKLLSLSTMLLANQAGAESDPCLLDRIHSPQVIKNAPIHNRGIQVGVVDSGFDTNHPLLKKHLVTGFNGRDNTFNVNCSMQINIGQLTNHGTHVAGIIAQVAPQVKIAPFKIGAEGHRPSEGFLKSLQELTKRQDIQIVNISMHLYSLMDYPQYYQAMVNLAKSGKLIVVSAGNFNEKYGEEERVRNLARLVQDPEVRNRIILVGASEKSGNEEHKVDYSAIPQTAYNHFVTAPGHSILSSVPTANGRSYQYMEGTSMAAPVVSAILAQLMAVTDCTVDEARSYLFQGCTNRYGNKVLEKSIYGHGIVDVTNSFKIALQHYRLKKATAELFKQSEALLEANKKKAIQPRGYKTAIKA